MAKCVTHVARLRFYDQSVRDTLIENITEAKYREVETELQDERAAIAGTKQTEQSEGLVTAPHVPQVDLPSQVMTAPPAHGTDVYLVDSIVDRKLFRGRMLYRVRWTGYL